MLEVSGRGLLEKWTSKCFAGVCSPVVHGGRIYLIKQRMSCLNLANGAVLWQGGSFGHDGSCLASADGYIVAYGNKGLAILDRAAQSPGTYRELARIDGICGQNEAWPHVVLAHGRIYCKDKRGNISCYAPPGASSGRNDLTQQRASGLIGYFDTLLD